MAAQYWADDDEGSSSSKPILQQREKALEVLYTFEKVEVAKEKGI